jgi:hypothetical protein
MREALFKHRRLSLPPLESPVIHGGNDIKNFNSSQKGWGKSPVLSNGVYFSRIPFSKRRGIGLIISRLSPN